MAFGPSLFRPNPPDWGSEALIKVQGPSLTLLPGRILPFKSRVWGLGCWGSGSSQLFMRSEGLLVEVGDLALVAKQRTLEGVFR